MRIQKIKVKGYKAFHKDYEFNIDGKNVFLYGENGSGKSSLYYAVKDLFQSSVEDIDFEELENEFLTQKQKGKGYIKIVFKPDKDGNQNNVEYHLKNDSKNTYQSGDTSIRDAIKLKSFLTYKHLLGVHYIDKEENIDLFDLLVNRVLKHFKSKAVTGDKELGELWSDVVNAIDRPLEGRRYNRTQKKTDVENAIGKFNNAFGKLFEEGSAENIHQYAQPILDEFGHNIEIKLNYTQAVPNDKLDGVNRNHVRIGIKYLNMEIDTPHLFLNEARLSAIAISIYLGMVKRHIQGNPCRILFLDDLFIGLDIGNRMPLLKILENNFINVTNPYQVFITTYDKPWYEFMKFYLDQNSNWKCFELYARRARKGFEIPVKIEQAADSHIQEFIDKGERYFNDGDNKAAGVYLRSAFEFILKKYCKRRSIPVAFKLSISKLNTEHLWIGLTKYEDSQPPSKKKLSSTTKSEIENLRNLVLNPLSHHDVNKHEITAEIRKAINAIKDLKRQLNV